MEKRGPSRFKPKTLKEVVDDAQKRAIQTKESTGQALLPPEVEYKNSEKKSLDVEQAKNEEEALKSYALRYPAFDNFFLALRRVAGEVMKSTNSQNPGTLKALAEKVGRSRDFLPNVSNETPVYTMILRAIVTDCMVNTYDSEEYAKIIYDEYVQNKPRESYEGEKG
jgi:hypothetical protein